MISLSIVVDKNIDDTAPKEVSIGTPLPLQRVKGTVSVFDAGMLIPRPAEDYTVSIVNENTVRIAVAENKHALAAGDIVNIAANCVGEVERP